MVLTALNCAMHCSCTNLLYTSCGFPGFLSFHLIKTKSSNYNFLLSLVYDSYNSNKFTMLNSKVSKVQCTKGMLCMSERDVLSTFYTTVNNNVHAPGLRNAIKKILRLLRDSVLRKRNIP